MAKRRRTKPNIPQAALEHARDQIEDDGAPAEAEATQTKQEKPVKAAKAESPTPARTTRRRTLQAATLEKRKNANAPLDPQFVAEMLAHPTKTVTEEELHADYGFVIKDLRNMAILAAVLLVGLIIVSVTIL